MEPVIIRLDDPISYLIPIGYSYWCSHLNLDDPHRPVTQPLSLKRCPQYWRSDDIRLVYSSPISETAEPITLMIPLYPGFPVYLRMIYHPLSFFTTPKCVMDNPKFLRTFEVFLNCYTKISDFFNLSSTLCNFFYFFFWEEENYTTFYDSGQPVSQKFLRIYQQLVFTLWVGVSTTRIFQSQHIS